MPTERIIYVSRRGQSDQLKLRDNEGNDPGNDDLTTKVDPGDSVVWQLDDNSGLSELTGVRNVEAGDRSYNPQSVNLLTSRPHSRQGKWEATVVSPSPGKGKFGLYMIGYKVQGSNDELWSDPRLEMKI